MRSGVRVGDRKEHPPGGREEASFGALGCICKSCESFLSSDPLSFSNQPILRRVDLETWFSRALRFLVSRR